MKNLIYTLLILLFPLHSQDLIQSIFVDFGPNDGTNGSVTPNPDVNGIFWNNPTDPTVNAAPLNLINRLNSASGITLSVNTDLATNGILNGGLLSPESNLLGEFAIATATQDYFYTPSSGQISFSNLDKTHTYVFHFFASRNTTDEIRITGYTLKGQQVFNGQLQSSGTGTGANGYAGNNNHILISDTIAPNSNGIITLNISNAQGTYGYLNTLKIEEFSGANTNYVNAYCTSLDPHKIVFMGSSVCQGYGSTGGNQGYAYRYTQLLNERAAKGGIPWQVVNKSVGGNNTILLMDRWENDLLPQCAKYVVYGLSGGNEGFYGGNTTLYDQFKNNMQTIIQNSRDAGLTPLTMNNYTRNDVSAPVYELIQNMNLEIHQWDIPSFNLLGTVDDGTGHWTDGFWNDGSHPNDIGYEEMMTSIVPSVFDAIDAKIPMPNKMNTTSIILGHNHYNTKVEFSPEDTAKSFTWVIDFKTDQTGVLLNIKQESGNSSISLEENTGFIKFTNASGQTITSQNKLNDNTWHQLALTHYWARAVTILYRDGIKIGRLNERIIPQLFSTGGAASPASYELRNLFFYRSGMTEREIDTLFSGKLLQSSLEIYAPLDGSGQVNEGSLKNYAQSMNSLAAINLVTQSSSSQVESSSSSSVESSSSQTSGITSDSKIVEALHYTLQENKVLTIKNYSLNKRYSISLFDITGMIIHQSILISANLQVDLNHYPSGLYIIQIVDGNHKTTIPIRLR